MKKVDGQRERLVLRDLVERELEEIREALPWADAREMAVLDCRLDDLLALVRLATA